MIVLKPETRMTIISLALVLMIASGLGSAIYMNASDTKIMALQSKAKAHDELIRSLWQQLGRKQDRLDTLLLSVLNSESNPTLLNKTITNYYIDKFEYELTAPLSAQDVKQASQNLEQQKTDIADRIDMLYLEKQKWEEQAEILTRTSAFYVSLALFIQLLSVAIMTIVRDLR